MGQSLCECVCVSGRATRLHDSGFVLEGMVVWLTCSPRFSAAPLNPPASAVPDRAQRRRARQKCRRAVRTVLPSTTVKTTAPCS